MNEKCCVNRFFTIFRHYYIVLESEAFSFVAKIVMSVSTSKKSPKYLTNSIVKIE